MVPVVEIETVEHFLACGTVPLARLDALSEVRPDPFPATVPPAMETPARDPPVIETALASCNARVPSSRLVLAPAAVEAPVPPPARDSSKSDQAAPERC